MLALKALAIITGAFITAIGLFVLVVWMGTRDIVENEDEPNINGHG